MSLYISDSSDWFPQEPNNGHLEYLLFLLAILTGIFFIIFIMVAKWYKYKTPDFDAVKGIPMESMNPPAYDNAAYRQDMEEPDALQPVGPDTRM